MTTPITSTQREAVQALINAVRPVGGGRSGIETRELTKFARDQPELAASAVQGFAARGGGEQGLRPPCPRASRPQSSQSSDHG